MATAAGFQYTPPSYLLRASDTTNRPWKKSEEEGDDVNEQENEYDLAQEDRPQTRRQSHLDAHFQQRVRNKQSRYRTIMKGEAELPEHSHSNGGEDTDEDEQKAKRTASRRFAGVVQHVFEYVFLFATLGSKFINSSCQSFSFDIPDTGSAPLKTKNSRISSSVSFSDIEFSMSPLS